MRQYFTCSENDKLEIDKEAERRGVTASVIIHEIVSAYFQNKKSRELGGLIRSRMIEDTFLQSEENKTNGVKSHVHLSTFTL